MTVQSGRQFQCLGLFYRSDQIDIFLIVGFLGNVLGGSVAKIKYIDQIRRQGVGGTPQIRIRSIIALLTNTQVLVTTASYRAILLQFKEYTSILPKGRGRRRGLNGTSTTAVNDKILPRIPVQVVRRIDTDKIKHGSGNVQVCDGNIQLRSSIDAVGIMNELRDASTALIER